MKFRLPRLLRNALPAGRDGGVAKDDRPDAVGSSSARIPVLVQDEGATVRLTGERLMVTPKDGPDRGVRLDEVAQLALLGNVAVTTPCIHALLARGVPIAWHSASGWLHGAVLGGHGQATLRLAQYRLADDPKRSLAFARTLVAAKIANARTLLRRRCDGDALVPTLDGLARQARAAGAAGGFDSLLGVEGAAARLYFAAFPQLLRNSDPAFRFAGRTRRPPADPVNAMLSFAYAMLLRHWLAALAAAGFDPYLGFFHRPLAGRAGLALDMMEPFRPLVADSAVVGAINNGEIRGDDFDRDGGAVLLNANGRKALIAAFERRMDILLTDPADEREKSYRRLFADQSRRLAQFLEEKRSDFPHHIPR